jgi:peptidyl-prolyl cis-trans isomerase D
MPNLDPSLLDSPQFRRETLDQLVKERVLLAAANDFHLFPDATRMRSLFDAEPSLQALRGPDGKLNRDLLAAQGMTPEMFDAQLRQQFGTQQVLAGVSQSAFTPPATAAVTLDALLQRREVQIQRFDPATYRAQAQPSDADVEAYYKSHETEFKAPEQAAIEYVVLSPDVLAKGLVVSEADARKYYDENAAKWSTPEERRASHILVKAEADRPKAEREAAKAKAEALLAQVRKNPASFAEVAKKESQDPGSAAQGGDLGWFGRGMMTKAFEDAAFSHKPGEIGDVVETEFGYHVLMTTGARGGEKKPFDAVRAEIETELRKQQAQKRYAEVAEQFSNLVYEQPDSLQPVIDKFKLDKQTATVQRQPMPGATGPLSSTKLLDAIFGSESVKTKRNTDAIETASSQLTAARIVTYQPARTLPLAEVKDKVRDRVGAEQASKLAKAEGEKRVAALRAAPNEALPTTVVVSRAQGQGQPREVLEAVMRADATKLPAILGVDLGDRGYVVARVTQVLPRETPPGGDAQLQQQLNQAWATAETGSYVAALKKRYRADIKEAALAASAPGS